MDATICLNLGCGTDIKKSTGREVWLNLDMFPNEGVDIVANLEKPIPLEDESVDMIKACHVIEHVQNLPGLMQELHRILRPKGTLCIRVPEFPCRAAIADPTHCRYFTPETFHHFAKSEIGFDTGGLRGLFDLKWLESIIHHRKPLDDGKPGAYFTEIWCEYEKPGDSWSWEKKDGSDTPAD